MWSHWFWVFSPHSQNVWCRRRPTSSHLVSSVSVWTWWENYKSFFHKFPHWKNQMEFSEMSGADAFSMIWVFIQHWKPLYIDISKFNQTVANEENKDRVNMLKEYWSIGRKRMKALYYRNEDPDLHELINFLESTFNPIHTHTSFRISNESQLCDAFILSPLLSMVVKIYDICKVVDMQTKISFIKQVMISSSVKLPH